MPCAYGSRVPGSPVLVSSMITSSLDFGTVFASPRPRTSVFGSARAWGLGRTAAVPALAVPASRFGLSVTCSEPVVLLDGMRGPCPCWIGWVRVVPEICRTRFMGLVWALGNDSICLV